MTACAQQEEAPAPHAKSAEEDSVGIPQQCVQMQEHRHASCMQSALYACIRKLRGPGRRARRGRGAGMAVMKQHQPDLARWLGGGYCRTGAGEVEEVDMDSR